jgi:hypothetical protein
VAHYFFSVAAAGAAGAVMVAVDVTADCTGAFGASCCWHPANAKIATTARAAMIADIFFNEFTPFLRQYD